jgi:hypothetical protein
MQQLFALLSGERGGSPNWPISFPGSIMKAGEVTDLDGETRKTLEDRLRKLRAELKERTSSIPIHSIRPHQLIEIEELEEEIGELEKKLEQA